MLVLYASSPVQRIVGVVEVTEVVVASKTSLWQVCTERGGGLTRAELRLYFRGKARGVAVLLGKIATPKHYIEPTSIMSNFVPPQSFRYLNADELNALEKKMTIKREKR